MYTVDVLITGGAGFIGSTLARRLVDEGVRVSVVDNLHPQVHAPQEWPADLPASVDRFRRDITVAADWDEVLAAVRPDVVVHLAAETGTGQSLTEASRHGRVNVVGTTEMLDAFTRHGHVPTGIVLTSSRAVYGEGRWAAGDVPFHARVRDVARLEGAAGDPRLWDPEPEPGVVVPNGLVHPLPHHAATTDPRPTNVYAATKLAQEHVLAAWTSAMGTSLAVLRLQNVYGPGQSLTNPYTGIVSLFGRLATEGERAEVYEDGHILRDFVFVDDVVAALSSAVGATAAGRSIPTLDIGSGEPVTLLELARTVARLAGSPEPTVCGKYRPGDVRAAHACVDDAAAMLGYRAKTDVTSGVRQLLAWIAGVDTTR